MPRKKKKEDGDGDGEPPPFRIDEKSAFQTLKIPLKTILCHRKVMQPLLHKLVFRMNDLMIHAYQFLRLYVLQCYQAHTPLPEINEKFCLGIIKTLGYVEQTGRPPKDSELLTTLQSFYETMYQPLVKHSKTNLKNTGHLTPYLATQMATCITTNIQEHFIQHFRRFINCTTSEITKDKDILHEFKNHLLECKYEKVSLEFHEWCDTHLEHIFPSHIQKNIPYDLRCQPQAYLPGMLYMNGILETQGNKLFQPLPLRNNIIPKHLVLDTASFIDLFCPEVNDGDSLVTKTNLMRHVKIYQDAIWKTFLKLDHSIFRNKHYQFHYQIQTDGFSCSLLFIRKDLKDKKWGTQLPEVSEQSFVNLESLSETQLQEMRPRNVVGCDPGKQNLVFMMDEQGNKLTYTAPQRRKESYAKRNHRILLLEKHRNRIHEKEAKLASYNSKSVDWASFCKYLKMKTVVNQETKKFYQRELWRKMKFRQFSYGKKSLDNFLQRIRTTFGDNIVIGYGNWSRNTQMKYCMPTKGVGLRRAIHKKYDTVTVNEAYTSQKCCGCHEQLSHYRTKEDNKEIFRLLVCPMCVSSPNKQPVYRTRDVNSAVNIRMLTRCWLDTQTRPVAFIRPPKEETKE